MSGGIGGINADKSLVEARMAHGALACISMVAVGNARHCCGSESVFLPSCIDRRLDSRIPSYPPHKYPAFYDHNKLDARYTQKKCPVYRTVSEL